MACLRSAESVREFVSAVTSTEEVIGIYTLIRNLVVMINILNSVEFSAIGLRLLAHSAGFANRIHAINSGTTLRLISELTKLMPRVTPPPRLSLCSSVSIDSRITIKLVPRVSCVSPRSATKLVSPCEVATKLLPRANWFLLVKLPLNWCPLASFNSQIGVPSERCKIDFFCKFSKSNEFPFHQEAFRFQKNECNPQAKSFQSSERERVQKKQKTERIFILKTDCDTESLFQRFYPEKARGTLEIYELSISSKVYCFYATA